MALEPITRAEQIMSGESLEPITREEMFIAKAAGMDVDTPEPITRREMFLSMIQPGGGSSLPSGSSPNQYLITDSEGVAGWEDKPTWDNLSGKPFAETRKLYETMADNVTITLSQRGSSYVGASISSMGSSLGTDFGNSSKTMYIDDELGSWALEYVIEINGVSYKMEKTAGVAYSVSAWYGDNADVEVRVIQSGGLEVYSLNYNGETWTVSMRIYATKVETLDERFIPDTIARTSDIPSQPDWNAAEGEPGHVLNRTHWVEEQGITITWDGDTTDRVNVSEFYKVSGWVSDRPAESYKGTVIGASVNGEVGELVLSASDLNEADGFVELGGYVAIVQRDNVQIHDITFPEKGVYFFSYNGIYITQCMIPARGTHPLPPSLGGMPTLAEDGSDAGKFVMANAAGTGYELVSMTNVAEEGA